MKLLTLLSCAVLVLGSFSACSTTKKCETKSPCCSTDGKCEAPVKHKH